MMLKISLFTSSLCLAACQLVPAPQRFPTPAQPGGLLVQAKHPSGQFLAMSDGSRWIVQPAGQASTLFWQPGDAVSITPRPHPAFPFVIYHARSGQGALARYLANP